MWTVVGQTTYSVLTISSQNPATIDAMAMTVAIPMTTPRMVSPERSLLAHSWSTAISQPSRMEWRVMLFGAQRFDRIEACRPVRGVDAEHDAHADAEAERDGDRPSCHAGGQGGRDLDERGQGAAGEETRDAAEQREDGRLREELASDGAPRRAERLEDPDLPGALGDAHQHEVHDHDRAHHHPDRPTGRPHREEDASELAPKRDQPLAGIDGKVVFLPWPEPVRDAHRFLCPHHAVRPPP